MSKTVDLLRSINDLMENTEDFNEKAYDMFLNMKEELGNKIGFIVEEIRRYDWLEQAADVAKKEADTRKKYYANQSKSFKRFLTYVLQQNGNNPIEAGGFRIKPKTTKQTWVNKDSETFPKGLGKYKIELNDTADMAKLEDMIGENLLKKSYDASKSQVADYINENDISGEFDNLEQAIKHAVENKKQFICFKNELYQIIEWGAHVKVASIEDNHSVGIK